MTKEEWLEGLKDALSEEGLAEITQAKADALQKVEELREHDPDLGQKAQELVDLVFDRVIDIRNYLKGKMNDPTP